MAWSCLTAVYSKYSKQVITPERERGGKSKSIIEKKIMYVNIVYGYLKSENSQDYDQKPQQNCMFMNSASEDLQLKYYVPFLCVRL
jgi:hypothetical protein